MTRKLKIKMKHYGYEYNLERDAKLSIKNIGTIIEELLSNQVCVDVEIGPQDSTRDDSLKLTYYPPSHTIINTPSNIAQAGKRFAESVEWLLRKLEENTEGEE